MEVDQNGVTVLEGEECIRLLAGTTIGRLALSVHALPVILPVNFALMTDGILIRTGAGSVFDQACNHAVVGFEVDGFDVRSHRGWSVLVQGQARLLEAPAELADAHRVGLTPWGNPSADTFIKVGLDIITGRRLGGWYWPHGFESSPAATGL